MPWITRKHITWLGAELAPGDLMPDAERVLGKTRLESRVKLGLIGHVDMTDAPAPAAPIKETPAPLYVAPPESSKHKKKKRKK